MYQYPEPHSYSPPPRRRRRWPWVVGGIVGTVTLVSVVSAVASSSSSAPAVPHSTVSAAPVPTAPAPSTPAAQPVAFKPQTLLSDQGMGTQTTRQFTSDSGNYIVSWVYTGNVQGGIASNFILSEDGGNDFASDMASLPNDIASAGHGSTEITGDTGTHRFNVQSVGSWTLKVTSEQ